MTQGLSVEQKAHLGRIAAKQFLSITDKWQLTDDQRRILAGAATRTTISTWRKRVKELKALQLGNDTYERLICIANIGHSLEYNPLLKSDDIAALLREPKDDLGHHSLLDNMLKGKVIDLYQTKDYIEQTLCAETPLLEH